MAPIVYFGCWPHKLKAITFFIGPTVQSLYSRVQGSGTRDRWWKESLRGQAPSNSPFSDALLDLNVARPAREDLVLGGELAAHAGCAQRLADRPPAHVDAGRGAHEDLRLAAAVVDEHL